MNAWLDLIGVAKRVFRQLLGERMLGVLDYFRFPDRSKASGGPFNGQPARQALFQEIVTKLRPVALVETGAHLGATTDLMAETGLPVFTIELDPRSCGYVWARFQRRRNVTVIHDDSRAGLCGLLRGRLRQGNDSTLFFYLDAHWNDDLPLAEEIEIVFGRCSKAIVMIDDFSVPWDPAYGYDDYGTGKALVPSYIAPAISVHRLQAFYPSTSSVCEGGARRGCVVLAKNSAHLAVLASSPLLRIGSGQNTNRVPA